MRNDNNYNQGKELKPHEAPSVIVGLFFTFKIVKLKAPNKTLKLKKQFKELIKVVRSIKNICYIGSETYKN